jgi:hypothetical protein
VKRPAPAAAIAVLLLVWPAVWSVSAAQASRSTNPVSLALRSRVIDLYHSSSISVSGISARRLDVRLLGAIDRSGSAYEWTPYRWRRLRPRERTWRGVLPAPPLFGAYRLQLRLDGGSRYLSSPSWLLRVFPHGTLRRPSLNTPVAAIRDFIAHLRGRQVMVACRHWPLASFDHRDPRLNRLFVVAYASRGDHRPDSRLGLFITTVRDGYQGAWRVLQATTQPYD